MKNFLIEAVERITSSFYDPLSYKQTLSQKEVLSVLSMFVESFKKGKDNSVTINIESPVVIVGDIHGQIIDLLRIFKISGLPSKTARKKYLFLGDYINRGMHSITTYILLLCLKLLFPENIFLLRGNHECNDLARVYGLESECDSCKMKVLNEMVESFNYLPFIGIISGEIICVHSGFSPYMHDRGIVAANDYVLPCEIPNEGLLCDLVWSEPDDYQMEWGLIPRGAGYLFGTDITKRILSKSNFSLLIRSHQLILEGYKVSQRDKEKNVDITLSIFSAPNYCQRCKNLGAYVVMNEDLSYKIVVLDYLKKFGKPIFFSEYGIKMEKCEKFFDLRIVCKSV